ncbi:hypothetical protein HYR69_05630 [Candidatus Sumerlaeota bacterium]|nr:hypothetical protein [Candidatus Sumerlaeota bacterium]
MILRRREFKTEAAAKASEALNQPGEVAYHSIRPPFPPSVWRRILSRLLFGGALALWGCGGGSCPCPKICPPDSVSDPITGTVLYKSDPNGNSIPIAQAPGGTATICRKLEGDDPSSGHADWNADDWAKILRLSGTGADRDANLAQIYTANTPPNCGEITGGPFSYKAETRVTWQGSMQWKAGEYMLTAIFDDYTTQPIILPGGTPYTAGPPGCYAKDDPAVTAQIKVILYKPLEVTGPDSVTRGDIASYTAEIEGMPEDKILGYHWYTDIHARADGALVQDKMWTGKMVLGGTRVYCTATIQCDPDGPQFETDPGSKLTSATPRGWSLEPPEEAVESDENLLDEDVATCHTVGDVRFGTRSILRDAETNKQEHVFTPNPPDSNVSWASQNAYTLEDIMDDGPNHSLTFVSDKNLGVALEFIVNEYLRPGGPLPTPAEEGDWYAVNSIDRCPDPSGSGKRFDPGLYLDALRAHENRGARPWLSGHYKKFLDAERMGVDVLTALEVVVGTSRALALADAEKVINDRDKALTPIAYKSVVGGNWTASGFTPWNESYADALLQGENGGWTECGCRQEGDP